MDYEANLKSRWDSLTSLLPANASSKWWDTICKRYSESGRHYHTLEHLSKMFLHFDAYQSKLQNPDAVTYAIFFHDLLYNPQNPDNEEGSVQLFKDFAKDCNIPEGNGGNILTSLLADDRIERFQKDSPAHKNVESLILLTKTHLTEEHKLEGVRGFNDEHYFLDIDMAILGSNTDEYKMYAEKIKQEYNFLPLKTYQDLRAKVLKSFLQIPNIFATQEFYDKYESQARANIQEEITTLLGQ